MAWRRETAFMRSFSQRKQIRAFLASRFLLFRSNLWHLTTPRRSLFFFFCITGFPRPSLLPYNGTTRRQVRSCCCGSKTDHSKANVATIVTPPLPPASPPLLVSDVRFLNETVGEKFLSAEQKMLPGIIAHINWPTRCPISLLTLSSPERKYVGSWQCRDTRYPSQDAGWALFALLPANLLKGATRHTSPESRRSLSAGYSSTLLRGLRGSLASHTNPSGCGPSEIILCRRLRLFFSTRSPATPRSGCGDSLRGCGRNKQLFKRQTATPHPLHAACIVVVHPGDRHFVYYATMADMVSGGCRGGWPLTGEIIRSPPGETSAALNLRSAVRRSFTSLRVWKRERKLLHYYLDDISPRDIGVLLSTPPLHIFFQKNPLDIPKLWGGGRNVNQYLKKWIRTMWSPFIIKNFSNAGCEKQPEKVDRVFYPEHKQSGRFSGSETKLIRAR